MTDYIPYEIAGIEVLLRQRLSAITRAHEAVVEAHRRLHQPIYDGYPFRNEDGSPVWQNISDEEQTRLFQVKWKRLGYIIPSLRGKVIVTGADIANDADNKEASSQTGIFRKVSEMLTAGSSCMLGIIGKKTDQRFMRPIGIENAVFGQHKRHG